jgi:hypothetical protein
MLALWQKEDHSWQNQRKFRKDEKFLKKGPHDLNEINPKLASDIHYWAEEFHITGQQLHEAIRVHGTHVSKIREALRHHQR